MTVKQIACNDRFLFALLENGEVWYISANSISTPWKHIPAPDAALSPTDPPMPGDTINISLKTGKKFNAKLVDRTREGIIIQDLQRFPMVNELYDFSEISNLDLVERAK